MMFVFKMFIDNEICLSGICAHEGLIKPKLNKKFVLKLKGS